MSLVNARNKGVYNGQMGTIVGDPKAPVKVKFDKKDEIVEFGRHEFSTPNEKGGIDTRHQVSVDIYFILHIPDPSALVLGNDDA